MPDRCRTPVALSYDGSLSLRIRSTLRRANVFGARDDLRYPPPMVAHELPSAAV
jgi:hypothetical protein